MSAPVRIVLGILLGALLATLPLLHYGLGGAHHDTKGDVHAHSTH